MLSAPDCQPFFRCVLDLWCKRCLSFLKSYQDDSLHVVIKIPTVTFITFSVGSHDKIYCACRFQLLNFSRTGQLYRYPVNMLVIFFGEDFSHFYYSVAYLTTKQTQKDRNMA